MEYDKLSYSIYSESKNGKEAEGTGPIFGKWKLIWFLLTNRFNKGIYSKRQKLKITLLKI